MSSSENSRKLKPREYYQIYSICIFRHSTTNEQPIREEPQQAYPLNPSLSGICFVPAITRSYARYIIKIGSDRSVDPLPTHWAHDVVATLNQRQWRWFNVATTCCGQWVEPSHESSPSKTRHSLNAVSMLVHRLLHWSSIGWMPRVSWGGPASHILAMSWLSTCMDGQICCKPTSHFISQFMGICRIFY